MKVNLQEITEENFDVILDIKYATLDNFTGQLVYKKPKCFLHKDMVPKLEKAIEKLTPPLQNHCKIIANNCKTWPPGPKCHLT